MTTVPELARAVLLGLSAFVVGMCAWMTVRHVHSLWRNRRMWDLWETLAYIGVAIIVALIGELLFGVPAVPVTWRAILYAVGLTFVLIGLIGVAASVGRRDKRATDREESNDGSQRG